MATTELERPPSAAALYGRAVLSLWRRRAPGGALPDTTLVLRRRVDVARLAEYTRVCGFRLANTVPSTYPQVLAFPLVLRLLTLPTFPFPAPGLVHVANRIAQRRPLHVCEPLELSVRAEHLRAHRRGQQVDVVMTAAVAEEEVWRAVATYLHRTPGSRSSDRGPTSPRGERRRSQPPAGGSSREQPPRTPPSPVTAIRSTRRCSVRGCSATGGGSCTACGPRRGASPRWPRVCQRRTPSRWLSRPRWSCPRRWRSRSHPDWSSLSTMPAPASPI